MNPRILMIEDDASICDMTKMNLNMNGFLQVYCASDGEEGLAMAARLVPDLILLDIMLPGNRRADRLPEFEEQSRPGGYSGHHAHGQGRRKRHRSRA